MRLWNLEATHEAIQEQHKVRLATTDKTGSVPVVSAGSNSQCITAASQDSELEDSALMLMLSDALASNARPTAGDTALQGA